MTFVRSDRDRPAALRLGSPGPLKVWVNGARRLHQRRRTPRGARPGRGRRPPGPRLEPDPDQDGDHRGRLAPLRALHRPGGAPLVLRGRGAASPPPSQMARRAARRPAPRVERWSSCSNAARGSWGARAARSGPIRALPRLEDAARSRRSGRVDGVRARARAAVAARPDAARGAASAARRRRHRRRRRTRAGCWRQALDAQPPPPWRALLLARLGVTARAARRDATRAGGVARGAGHRSRPAGRRRWRSPRRRRTPGCR